MEKYNPNQETQRKSMSGLTKILASSLVAGASIFGMSGCATLDKVEFKRENSSIGLSIRDKDGIKIAQIIDNQGVVVYDILKVLRRDEEPFSFSLPSTPSGWISAYLSSLFPKKDDGLTREINFKDYSKTPFGLDFNKNYILMVEDGRGNVTRTPLRKDN